MIRARIAAAGESLRILSGPPAALGTIELARSINELTDRSIRQVHAACQDGHRVACRSGCTYCCMVPVAASAPEVLAIATFVRERFDEERRAALDARIKANIAATEGMDMDQRDRVRLDCPFLEAGKCTVYEVRPVACRGYSSYSVEDCREDYEQPGTGVEAAYQWPPGACIRSDPRGAGHRVQVGLGRASPPRTGQGLQDRLGGFDAGRDLAQPPRSI